jgi:hypothetical protein
MISVVGILVEKQNALCHNRLIHANSAYFINNNSKAIDFSYKIHKRSYYYKTKFDILEKVDIEITDNAFCINFQSISVLTREILKS